MIREAQITHGRDGYALRVAEVPMWAIAAERASETVCGWTGSFLCGTKEWPYKVGIGQRDEYGSPRWNLGSALFAFGQWSHTIAGRRERDCAWLPVTTEWVAEHFPGSRIEWLENGESPEV
ncbi:hypothetical protein IMZ11_02145 [Microtetraspora sp. AC03309]|uniref:hypothetical protein n=1 Tax=Microtetraspora sp. AC03309 TaxID=2779376 RepID=UPI001E5CAC6B|nr:hypothetical protein [Microtetraspora sp. AC03309]MCC5574441.1 hypothetical protein [Microtetraspora sp. AC03309]